MRAGSSTWLFVAGALLAVAPGPAGAQAQGRSGGYFLVGGGVTDFIKSDVKDRFHTGGTWDARFGVGNGSFLGAEASYVGSYRTSVGSGPKLLMNGAEAVIRLQYPMETASWIVEPFAFGGIGWSYVSLQSAPAGTANNDNIGVVPFGAGITFGAGGLLLDARFTYRTTFNDDLPIGLGGSKDLRSWDVTGNVGWAF